MGRQMLQPTKDRLRTALRDAADRIEALTAENLALREGQVSGDKVFFCGLLMGWASALVGWWVGA